MIEDKSGDRIDVQNFVETVEPLVIEFTNTLNKYIKEHKDTRFGFLEVVSAIDGMKHNLILNHLDKLYELDHSKEYRNQVVSSIAHEIIKDAKLQLGVLREAVIKKELEKIIK